MWTRVFWREALERALKSAAQAPLLVWLVGDAIANIWTLNWSMGFGVAAGAAVISLLTSIASAPLGPANTPSLAVAPVAAPARRPDVG